MSDRSTYRKRWLDVSYKAGYLKQIANAQAEFINHLCRCSEDNCVYNQETGQCATRLEYYDKMIYAYEVYENYVTTGCPISDTEDSEREPEARPNQIASGTGTRNDTVREGVSDDEWFGGIV